MKDVLIIMPCYNESSVLNNVLQGIIDVGFTEIVLIDDCSRDNSIEIASKFPITILKHPINIGLGGALSTGLLFAKLRSYKYAITFDSDGQHNPEDALKVYKRLQDNTSDLVIGSRLSDMKRINVIRYITNRLGDVFLYLLYGIKLCDTQSGLRGFSKRFIDQIELASSKYEVSSEIVVKAKKLKLKIGVIPIKAIYTEYSLERGQKISNSINIALRLVAQKINQ